MPIDEACPSRGKLPRRSRRRTRTASSTAISSRRISSSRRRQRQGAGLRLGEGGRHRCRPLSGSGRTRRPLSIADPRLARNDPGWFHSWHRALHEPGAGEGKASRQATDIWAFGCVLYEMLAGRRAFDGDDVADVLAKVLQRDPDYAVIDRNAPPSVRKLLR